MRAAVLAFSAIAGLGVALGIPGCAGAPVAEARVLVAYERSGGFAGVRERTTVTTRGRVRSQGRRFRISQPRLRALRRVLRAADFSSLERRYAPDGQVADGFVEAVTHAGRTVFVETGGDPPRRLTRVLGRLRRLSRS